MMNPVVRMLVQRAEARRYGLLELAMVIPEDYLSRRAQGDEWSARVHFVHALLTDRAVTLIVRAIAEGVDADHLGAVMESMIADRSAEIRSAEAQPTSGLVDASVADRANLYRELTRLTPAHLDAVLPVSGARNSWGQPLGISLVQYLEQWCHHDSGHEAAIRRAMATSPDLSTVALTRRLR